MNFGPSWQLVPQVVSEVRTGDRAQQKWHFRRLKIKSRFKLESYSNLNILNTKVDIKLILSGLKKLLDTSPMNNDHGPLVTYRTCHVHTSEDSEQRRN